MISIDDLKKKAESQGATLTFYESGCINAIYPSGNFIMTSYQDPLQDNIKAVYDFLERVSS